MHNDGNNGEKQMLIPQILLTPWIWLTFKCGALIIYTLCNNIYSTSKIKECWKTNVNKKFTRYCMMCFGCLLLLSCLLYVVFNLTIFSSSITTYIKWKLWLSKTERSHFYRTFYIVSYKPTSYPQTAGIEFVS